MAPGHGNPGHCAVWIGHRGHLLVSLGLFREELDSAVVKEPVLSLRL